ncbi:Ppx/GppA phosphatase family protein [uncultured Ilyobacter sp.]|uniref:Ppx/GppA phosphatase family protein n=1 Tax=uncultured Ilyobacter sp. TaxID=544433 RepID=UPI0029C78383|nr:Ppx/GppA phosphatase family protein [uncultured Ilyobacter sp.]
MKKIGIIDIGSNSIRLVIFRISPAKNFSVIEDVKESVRLGEGVNETGKLKVKKIDLAYHTLKIFKGICDQNETDEIIAFATAAVRNASNSHRLIEKVEKELQMEIKIFTGEEEAYYSLLGATNTLDISEGLLIDMGGASTELVWFKKRRVHKWVSLNFGSVTLAQVANVKERLSDYAEKKLAKYVLDEYEKVPWLKELGDIPLVGVGGTIRNMAKVHSDMCEYPLNILHDYSLKDGDVNEIFEHIKRKNYLSKLEIRGLSKSRADIFTGALCAVVELLKFTGLEMVVISGSGIREGVLYQRLNEYGKQVDNVFENSLSDVMEHFDLSKERGERVYQIFMKIFESMKPLHGIPEVEDKVIRTASYLGRVGVNINYYDNPLHSFYMIINSGLKGIKHRKLLMAALIVSQQDKFNDMAKNYRSILGKKDIGIMEKLSVMLRISKIFNRVFLLDSDRLSVEVGDESVTFHIENEDLLDVQISRVLMSGKRFREVFGRQLIVTKKKTD